MKAHIYLIATTIMICSCMGGSGNIAQRMDSGAYGGGNISISEDSVLRVESGSHPGGGTSPEYWAVFSFAGRKGDTCRVVMDYSPYMQNIHAIHKKDGSTYYMVNCFAKASSSYGEEWLQAYRIAGDSLVRVSVIDGGKDYGQVSFSVEYSIPDWYSATWGAGYDWMFEYDAAMQDLYVPLTDKNDHYILNDRYRLWHFNGERFVDKGERPHRGLHPSLAKYACLIRYLTTEDCIVRVDSLENRALRYASWKKPKTMADAPDMVITGGTRRHFPCEPDGHQRDDEFSFIKDGYEYIVRGQEIISYKDSSTF